MCFDRGFEQVSLENAHVRTHAIDGRTITVKGSTTASTDYCRESATCPSRTPLLY